MYCLPEQTRKHHAAAPGPDRPHWTCELHIHQDLHMVGVVRHLLRTALGARASEDFVDVACLLATEVVGNALRHGDCSVRVLLRDDGCVLHCAVEDTGPRFRPASPGPADELTEGGRGLLLVDACATRWGIRSSPSGTGNQVWFQLTEHTCGR
ncbi:ATP-binding protein [Streptomyces sp. NPDC048297]|uniref:ATP-binding protein n=1 Tax=Streptomyces sp. NPDC048297 TaxID=3365531 RepID=UPI003714CBB8